MSDQGLPNETLYEVISTIIPLLIVVLFVEYRSRRLDWDGLKKDLAIPGLLAPVASIILILALGLAEAAALDVLYRAPDKPPLADQILIEVGLAVGGAGVWVPLALRALLDIDKHLRGKRTTGRTGEILGRQWEWPTVCVAIFLTAVFVSSAIVFLPHFGPR